MPALSSALAYFDLSRTARSTADLTQAQRDFFGAHGFERIGAPGVVAHGPWAMAPGELHSHAIVARRTETPRQPPP